MKRPRVEYFLIVLISIVSIGLVLFYEKLRIDVNRNDLWYPITLFFAIVLYVIVRNIMNKKSDPYEIINALLTIFALYAMMLPFNYLINVRYLEVITTFRFIPAPIMFQYIVICLIGVVGLLIGYYWPFAGKYAAKLPVLKVTYRELKITGFVLLALGIMSFATNVASFGGLSNYIKVGYGGQRYVIGREALAFGSGLELMGISLILLIYAATKEEKKILFVFLVFVFLGFLSIALLIGQRRYIVYVILMAFIIFNYGIRRIKLRWVLVLSLLLYIFFFTYAHTRGIWSKVGIIKGTIETYNFAIKNPGLLLPFVGGEFIPPSHAVVEVLRDNTFHLKYGSSYVVGLIRVLPRVGKLWPEALRNLAEWRLDTYYPGLRKIGIGFVFFTVAEGLVNFWYLGVLCHMFFYGLIAKVILLYYRRNNTETFALLMYAASFPLMLFEGIHAEFGQVLWYATHTYIGPLLLIILLTKLATRTAARL